MKILNDNTIFTEENNFIKNSSINTSLLKGNLNTNTSLITIIIPTFKRGKFLKEAIDSVINQKDFIDWELLIIDNDPENIETDTSLLINTYKNNNIFYYKNSENLGMTGNWNRGIELARSKYITILHDDDLLHPNFLTEMFKYLSTNSHIDLLVSNCYVSDLPFFPENKNLNNDIVKISTLDLIYSNISPFPGIIFKKELAIKIGGFKDQFYPCSDYEFWANYCMRFNCFKTHKTLAFYRIQDNESLKLNTRIEITRVAYLIQSKLINILKLDFIKDLILLKTIGNLLHNYCKDLNFKNSQELNKLEKELNISKLYKNKYFITVYSLLINKLLKLILLFK